MFTIFSFRKLFHRPRAPPKRRKASNIWSWRKFSIFDNSYLQFSMKCENDQTKILLIFETVECEGTLTRRSGKSNSEMRLHEYPFMKRWRDLVWVRLILILYPSQPYLSCHKGVITCPHSLPLIFWIIYLLHHYQWAQFIFALYKFFKAVHLYQFTYSFTSRVIELALLQQFVLRWIAYYILIFPTLLLQ